MIQHYPRWLRMFVGITVAISLQLLAQYYFTGENEGRQFTAMWKLANLVLGAVIGLGLDWLIYVDKLEVTSSDQRRFCRAIVIAACIIGMCLGG